QCERELDSSAAAQLRAAPVPRDVEDAQKPFEFLVVPCRIERADETAEPGGRHPRVEALRLRHIADAALDRDGHTPHAPSEQLDLAARGTHDAHQGMQRRGFSRAVAPEEAVDLTPRNSEGQTVERAHAPVPDAQIVEPDRELHGTGSYSARKYMCRLTIASRPGSDGDGRRAVVRPGSAPLSRGAALRGEGRNPAATVRIGAAPPILAAPAPALEKYRAVPTAEKSAAAARRLPKSKKRQIRQPPETGGSA